MSFRGDSIYEQSQKSKKVGSHALVIGGSLAGMLTARILCNYFDRVTVIERDRYPESPMIRKGVPQAHHVHVLMMRGRLIIERLFPGLQDEMIDAGAPIIDIAGEMAWLTPAGWGVMFPSELTVLAFSRPLLDWHVRRRLNQFKQVKILENTEVIRLLPDVNNEGVAGAIIRSRELQGGEQAPEEHLSADLIIDAGGRGSQAPRWLEALGYPRPEETFVNGFLGYASRLYRIPRDFKADWKCAFIQAAPPERVRGGILFPVEGDRWLLTVVGGGRDYPPTGEADFLEFVRSLASPVIYEAVKGSEPLSPIHSYRATENRRRHFERLSRQPQNFLVTGDAACAFNPVYGQGMTTAAMGALALEEAICEQSSRRPDGSFKGLSRRFQKKLAKVNAAPWLLATGEDFRYRETEGGRPNLGTRLMHRYMDQVVCLTTTNKKVRRVLLENFHMLKTPASLFHSRIIFQVVRRAITPTKKQTQTGRLPQTVGDAVL